jgi:hypothetical protein
MAAPSKEQTRRCIEILENNWDKRIAEESDGNYWRAVAVDLFRSLLAFGIEFPDIKENMRGLWETDDALHTQQRFPKL